MFGFYLSIYLSPSSISFIVSVSISVISQIASIAASVPVVSLEKKRKRKQEKQQKLSRNIEYFVFAAVVVFICFFIV